MLVVETVVRIRREYAAGKPIKAICWELRLSRKVVRKAIRAEEGAFSYHRATQPFPKIGPVRERLEQLLVENEARPRRDRLKLTRVWDPAGPAGLRRLLLLGAALRGPLAQA